MRKTELWNLSCCCGSDGHTIREGGDHINLVQTRKLARWPYMTASNFLVPESTKYPLAVAVVCCRCLADKKPILYVTVGEDDEYGGVKYSRVPIEELEEPEYYWPDHHPDREKGGDTA